MCLCVCERDRERQRETDRQGLRQTDRCVCVCERERERERDRQTDRQMCVSVCVCVLTRARRVSYFFIVTAVVAGCCRFSVLLLFVCLFSDRFAGSVTGTRLNTMSAEPVCAAMCDFTSFQALRLSFNKSVVMDTVFVTWPLTSTKK